MASVSWQEWEGPAFERATREDRPILLVLTASWCRFCRELLETTLADPEVVHEVESGFVPVLADTDRRPDLNQRYNMGGWPTIAFLTPAGDLIAGDTYLTASEFLPLLRNMKSFFRERRSSIETGLKELWAQKDHKPGPPEQEAGSLSPVIVRDVVHSMVEKFDTKYGGWGDGQKFPHPEALDFAMVHLGKTGDERVRRMVELTLDRMMEGGIYDPVDGGFFRFSTTRDWRVPNFEKVLDVNAGLLRCYLEGYQFLGRQAYRAVAESTARWLLTFMKDEETGAFCGSLDADPEYYGLDRERRAQRGRPRIDRTIYTNWNAMAAASLLKASVVLEDGSLRKAAMDALEFLLQNLYRKDGGMYHYWDGTYHLPGILSDQAYMVLALVDAAQFTGDSDLLLPAEDLAETLIEKQRAPSGGFFDIPHDPRSQGGLRRRNRSILENAVIAEALTRLAYLSRRDEFMRVARSTLEAFARDYKEYGYYVAGYARAVDLFFYEPLAITVVGDRASPAGMALRTAAQKPYVPSRIVQALDPKFDPILIKRSGYPATERPVAYLCVGKTTKAVVEDPDELVKKMGEIEESRKKKIADGE